MFNTASAADFSAFTAPIQKLVDLNTATLTKAVEAQKAAAESQMSLLQSRAQAAMEIKDPEGLTAFLTKQGEIAKSSFAELTESSKTVADDIKAYFTEVQAIFSQK